jgi:hypothetical protein
MSAKDYPPVPGPGARQIAYGVLLGEVVPKEKWNSWTFSEAFKDRYGVPVHYWSHWDRLTSISCRKELFPKLRSTIYEVPKHMDFVRFARHVDKKGGELGHEVPDRQEMEALYTQFLLQKFDELEGTDIIKKSILRQAMSKAS